MREIKRVETTEEAMLIKSLLESCGIDCFLKDRETIAVYPLYSNAIGGIKILVQDECEDEVAELLNCEPLIPREKHCPVCDSQNVRYRRFGLLGGICILSGFCLPSRQHMLCCLDCNQKFEENEVQVRDISNHPGFIELNKIAESQPLNDVVEGELPSYFSTLSHVMVTVIIMLILTPIFYMCNGALPSKGHFLWGMITGVIIGSLIKYSTKVRLASRGNPEE